MELYFIIKTILCKTVLMRRQIYMYISLIMKCQQLQMKLLTFKNSNKKSLLLTKRTCICSSKRFSILLVLNFPSTEFLTSFLCKTQTWSLFSAIRKSRHQYRRCNYFVISKNRKFASNTPQYFLFCLVISTISSALA